ncbi:Uncharacterized protein Rs2_19261 [Raphanus sativus]|nr:Uncharacterized protein Rs2_19261 [Raphanus sativus]
MVSQGMVSLTKSLCITTPRIRLKNPKMMQNLKSRSSHHLRVLCTKMSQWEPSPFIRSSSAQEAGNIVLEKTANVFESIVSETAEEEEEEKVDSSQTTNSHQVECAFLDRFGLYIQPRSYPFLLMADSCARPKDPSVSCKSKPPFSYKFWNVFALLTGFLVPTLLLFGSQTGLLGSLQPELPFISSAVLLFPYFILLAVQTLTEILTWSWQSPVWLVTPVVYEAYRVLQLMRGLKLSAEVNAPVWVVHMIRGLVSWWVLILGMQLMRVAWFAGYASRTTRANQQPELSVASK